MANNYPQECPIGRTMNVVGDRWTMMILRDFFLYGDRRFQDLQDSFDDISPNTLSARLKHLEKMGVLERYLYEEHPPRSEYRLTKKGKDFGPVMAAVKTWGNKYK